MSVAEFLMLKPCNNCGRNDRLSVRPQRRKLFVECDCGAGGAGHPDIMEAIMHWNTGLHWTAANAVSQDGCIYPRKGQP